jgi:multiple sugar transport system ATP-binding protein
MNLLQGTLIGGEDGDLELDLGSQKLQIDRAVLNQRPALRDYFGRKVVAGIRPEDMEDAALVPGADGTRLQSTADLVEAMGSDVLVHFVVDAPQVVTDDTKELARDVGTDVLGALEARPHTDMVARFSPRTRVRVGEPVTVQISIDRLHYFDPDSGLSIWGD